MTLIDGSLEANGRFSIRINWIFSHLLRFRSYEAKCVQLGYFHRGSTSLHPNITWTGCLLSPVNHYWHQK